MNARAASLLAWWLMFGAGSAVAAAGQSEVMKVVRIIDGDTVEALDAHDALHRIRLAGIDAPESRQPFSERSRQLLADLVFHKSVWVDWNKMDRYGRRVGTLTIEPSGLDANLEMVKAGLAWHYKEFEAEQSVEQRQQYGAAEQAARDSRIGIWSEANPIEPAQWRRPRSETVVKKSRSHICHAPGTQDYASVLHFTAFATIEECLADGGRLPRRPSR